MNRLLSIFGRTWSVDDDFCYRELLTSKVDIEIKDCGEYDEESVGMS